MYLEGCDAHFLQWHVMHARAREAKTVQKTWASRACNPTRIPTYSFLLAEFWLALIERLGCLEGLAAVWLSFNLSKRAHGDRAGKSFNSSVNDLINGLRISAPYSRRARRPP